MPYKDRNTQLKYQKDHYQNKQENYAANQRSRRAKVRELINDIKATNGCAACPENTPCCLAFHHDDPDSKIDKINMIYKSKGLKYLLEEIKKCTILCHNCHAKAHAGILEYERKVPVV